MDNFNSKFLLNSLKIIFGILLIIFLIIKYLNEKVPLSNISIEYNIFLIGMLLIVLSFVFSILKLHLVISQYVRNFFESGKIFFIGWFFSHLLPTNMGGDLYQIAFLRNRTRSLSKATALISIQRIIPAILILIYAIIYSIIRPGLWLKIIAVNQNITFMNLFFIFVFLIVFLWILYFLLRKKLKNWFEKIRGFILNFFKSINEISKKKYLQLIVFSLIFQGSRMSGLYVVLLGFDQHLNIPDLFFIFVMVALLSMIPLSIGALGIQESGIVFGLQLLNVPIHIGILVAFLYRGIFILFAIFGGIIFLLSKKEHQNFKTGNEK